MFILLQRLLVRVVVPLASIAFSILILWVLVVQFQIFAKPQEIDEEFETLKSQAEFIKTYPVLPRAKKLEELAPPEQEIILPTIQEEDIGKKNIFE